MTSSTTKSFDDYASLIIQDLNDNGDVSVVFKVPGLHEGNYIFSEEWTDKLISGHSHEDFFQSIKSFLKGYFESKGVDPERVNVKRGELLKENQSKQYYYYESN